MIKLPPLDQSKQSFACIMGISNYFYDSNFRSDDWRNFGLLASFGKIEFGKDFDITKIIDYCNAINLSTLLIQNKVIEYKNPIKESQNYKIEQNDKFPKNIFEKNNLVLISTRYNLKSKEVESNQKMYLGFVTDEIIYFQNSSEYGNMFEVTIQDIGHDNSLHLEYILYIKKEH